MISKNKNSQINDESLAEESKSKLEKAEEEKEVADCNRGNEFSNAWHYIKVLTVYVGFIIILFIVIINIVYAVNETVNHAVNAMGFSIIGAVLGAIVSHLLTKK